MLQTLHGSLSPSTHFQLLRPFVASGQPDVPVLSPMAFPASHTLHTAALWVHSPLSVSCILPLHGTRFCCPVSSILTRLSTSVMPLPTEGIDATLPGQNLPFFPVFSRDALCRLLPRALGTCVPLFGDGMFLCLSPLVDCELLEGRNRVLLISVPQRLAQRLAQSTLSIRVLSAWLRGCVEELLGLGVGNAQDGGSCCLGPSSV